MFSKNFQNKQNQRILTESYKIRPYFFFVLYILLLSYRLRLIMLEILIPILVFGLLMLLGIFIGFKQLGIPLKNPFRRRFKYEKDPDEREVQ